jgi:sodium transport system ATP-binding protein
MIEARGLYKSFNQVVAVKNVSFTAADGKITGILGPNGAGKTTTLRMLYTLLKPDQGSARVDDYDVVRDTRAAQRRMGVLPDNYGLYSRLTPREHIRYFGRMHGLKNAALERQVDDLVKLLDMQGFADRRVEGFSQGQRLKTAIARALVHQPHNVILDEPTNGLDVMSTRAMRTLIRRFRDEGKCVLFSSHIIQEVAALCDHIVVIAHGVTVADGTPDDLRQSTGQANLEDAFVAVIGSEEGLML